MARRVTRRRNGRSLRSIGSMLINPRVGSKRRKTTTRRKRRRVTGRKRRTTARRRVNGSKRRKSIKVRRRRNSSARRRKAPRVTYRRKNGVSRRRNPAFVQSLATKARKLPVVGGLIAKWLSFAPHAALGAVAVEVPWMGMEKLPALAGYLPASVMAHLAKPLVYFTLVGSLMGLAAMKFFPGSAETKKRLAIGLMAGSAGAGYALHKSASAVAVDPTAAETMNGVGNYGAIQMQGLDPQYAGYGEVGPYSIGAGYGAVMLGR